MDDPPAADSSRNNEGQETRDATDLRTFLLETQSSIKTLTLCGLFFVLVGGALMAVGFLLKLKPTEEEGSTSFGSVTNSEKASFAATLSQDLTDAQQSRGAGGLTGSTDSSQLLVSTEAPVNYPSVKELKVLGPVFLAMGLLIWFVADLVRKKYVICKVAPAGERKQETGVTSQKSVTREDMVDEERLQALFYSDSKSR